MRPLTWAAILLTLGARPLLGQASEILGTWKGTSTCVKEDWNSACHDEQVIYFFARAPNQPDSIALDAQKLVNGTPEPMGIMTLGYDTATKAWAGEWRNARYHLRWSFVVNGKVLTGTLLLLPERRVARRIVVRKD